MKAIILNVLVAAALGLAAPALADPAEGQVEEIIIKVKTEDGVKWYRLGKDLEPVNIKAGDRVRFDYADDAIEAITVEEEPAEGGGTGN